MLMNEVDQVVLRAVRRRIRVLEDGFLEEVTVHPLACVRQHRLRLGVGQHSCCNLPRDVDPISLEQYLLDFLVLL